MTTSVLIKLKTVGATQGPICPRLQYVYLNNWDTYHRVREPTRTESGSYVLGPTSSSTVPPGRLGPSTPYV